MRGRGPGRRNCSTSSTSRPGCCRRSSSRELLIGRLTSDVSQLVCRNAGRGARVPRHRIGGGVGPGRPAPRLPQLGHLVAARHGSRRADHHGAVARAELHQRRRRVRHDAAAQEHRRHVAAAGVPADVGGRGPVARLRRAADDGGRRAAGVQGAVRPGSHDVSAPARHGVGHRARTAARRHRPSRKDPAATRARSSRASRSSTASCSTRSRS